MNKIEIIKSKIYENYNDTSFERLLSFIKFKNQSIVFTNGCFDIIHRGHIEYLTKASELGNFLIIGLNTDESVKLLKGNNRPVQNQNDRALILASLQFVNAVVLFSEETPYNLINLVKPHTLVKGGDYNKNNIVGYDIVISNGGKVETIDFVEGCSTTSILSKI